MNNLKILFVSHDPFSVIGSNGKTYLSLFSDFNDNDIAQLYFNNLYPSTTKFNNFFRIREVDILKLKFLFHKISGKVADINVHEIKPQYGKRSIFKSELIKIIRNFIFSLIDITKINNLDKWINDFEPDVIFFVGANYIFQYKSILDISRRYNIPYSIYFTDDYFIYNNGNNFITKFLHQRFVLKNKPIVEGAKELFVISPKMKNEYELYFNKKCSILINAIDKKDITPTINKFNTPIILRYFGWLHSNRSSSLGILGQCLQYINDNYKYDCVLEVYSLSELTEDCKNNFAINTIKICEPLMGEAYQDVLQSSNFLVHAESFDEAYTQITMLSISTKIPEYLLSNRCIIAIGPPELASISVLEENNLAIVLSKEKTINENSLQILRVIEDKEMYNQYCERAIKYCRSEFNSVKMRKSLKEKLSQVK